MGIKSYEVCLFLGFKKMLNSSVDQKSFKPKQIPQFIIWDLAKMTIRGER